MVLIWLEPQTIYVNHPSLKKKKEKKKNWLKPHIILHLMTIFHIGVEHFQLNNE